LQLKPINTPFPWKYYFLASFLIPIAITFLSMIRHFLMAILLAGIFSALAHPLYCWFEGRFRGRQNLAFMFTLLFILLYSMFFFLIDGKKLLHKILYYLPLEDHEEQQILDKFTSVTRATLKGTAVIGILQGGLAGIAFFGVIGFIIGPIIAALFVTIWDIYGLVFCDVLPEVGSLNSDAPFNDGESEALEINDGEQN
jgi:predicted PurR-regulated permease PerM